MGSRRAKKKTLKQRQATKLKDPSILLAALIEKMKKYMEELEAPQEVKTINAHSGVFRMIF